MILGIETSCDETAAAVVTEDGEIVANVVASQAELHARFGGVVPEVASRRHLELIVPVLDEALDGREVDAVAVTTRPGLIGALLVGVSAAKALAWAWQLPLHPVDHLHGHVASLYLRPLDLEPPFTCLLASGGHTMLLDVKERGTYNVLGTTLDDAAGEAFDKGARLLGLGYPGGRELDLLAREGDPTAYAFPVARVPGLDFSFSGLKTALLYRVRDLPPEELAARRADLAASYQRALVRALVERVDLLAAGVAEPEQARALVERLAGGVVERRPEHAVAAPVLHVEQHRVPAAREQAGERRLQVERLQVERGHVPVQVVDGHEREPPRPGERLRSGDPHEQGADQPGPRGDGDRVDLVAVECLGDDRRDQLQVPPARHLGHDAAEARVQLRLRRDDVRDDLAVLRHDRRRGLVAARLDPEDHACRESRHMISASSRLSV